MFILNVLGPPQSPIQWVPGVRQPGREATHSLPSSGEVKNVWSYTSTHLVRLLALCSVKKGTGISSPLSFTFDLCQTLFISYVFIISSLLM
jgi:hypothetical protein